MVRQEQIGTGESIPGFQLSGTTAGLVGRLPGPPIRWQPPSTRRWPCSARPSRCADRRCRRDEQGTEAAQHERGRQKYRAKPPHTGATLPPTGTGGTQSLGKIAATGPGMAASTAHEPGGPLPVNVLEVFDAIRAVILVSRTPC
jgi:hypothetical protein